MLKYIPGLVGAVAAYIALKVMNAVADPGLATQTVVFFILYFIIAVAADKGLSSYGKPTPPR